MCETAVGLLCGEARYLYDMIVMMTPTLGLIGYRANFNNLRLLTEFSALDICTAPSGTRTSTGTRSRSRLWRR